MMRRKNNKMMGGHRPNGGNGDGGGGKRHQNGGGFRRPNNARRYNNGGQRGQTYEGKTKQQALQAKERYLAMAQEALRSGDRVQSEYYFQHADHYTRIVNYFEEQEREEAAARGETKNFNENWEFEEGENEFEGEDDTSRANAPATIDPSVLPPAIPPYLYGQQLPSSNTPTTTVMIENEDGSGAVIQVPQQPQPFSTPTFDAEDYNAPRQPRDEYKSENGDEGGYDRPRRGRPRRPQGDYQGQQQASQEGAGGDAPQDGQGWQERPQQRRVYHPRRRPQDQG